MTYLGEKRLGNFKPSTSARLKAKRDKSAEKRADRPGNSDEHLAALRKCPCVVTLKVPAGEVHHLKYGTNERGAGMRASDRWGIPLSRLPHEACERRGSRGEPAFFREHGIADPLDLAHALWKASPNVSAMTKIILTWPRGEGCRS